MTDEVPRKLRHAGDFIAFGPKTNLGRVAGLFRVRMTGTIVTLRVVITLRVWVQTESS